MNGKLGVMLDCSRYAVMNVPALNRFISLISKMGYNRFMLYTEDTYEIEGEPLFGYLRGRYTASEIKEIDEFCANLGVELVPCIQTLAHLNQIFTWQQYAAIRDVNDILLVDDDKTYQLIDKMFYTCAQNFTSRKILIGMDEAHMLGLGKYLDKHGFTDRSKLFLKHLKKVCDIAQKYGFEPMMWSDMFFSLSFGKYYVYDDQKIPDEVKALVPENVELVYWDYYTNTEEQYSAMLDKHQSFGRKFSFAGGAWKWETFTPNNAVSIRRNEQAFKALNKHNVTDVIITLWGDNGNECPANAVIPTLFHAAECAKGNYDLEDIKRKFKDFTGVCWDDFMLLNMYLPDELPKCSPTGNGVKTMFYNDCLCGKYDYSVIGDGSEGKAFTQIANKLLSAKKSAGEYEYLIDYYYTLASFISVKYDLWYRAKKAYADGDKKALKLLVKDYDLAIKRLDKFYQAFKRAWYYDNKAFGFEVTDIRIGGVKQRLTHAKELISDFVRGKIDKIEELEITPVNYLANEDGGKKIPYAFMYANASSANRLA